jgi:hypothetical protein
MTRIAQQVLPMSGICDSAHGGWIALDPETNEIAGQDHDPAMARLKAVEAGVLRPILLGAKTAGITARGAITVKKR